MSRQLGDYTHIATSQHVLPALFSIQTSTISHRPLGHSSCCTHAIAGVEPTIACARKTLPVAIPRASGDLTPTFPSSDARNWRILPRRLFFISIYLLSAGVSIPAGLSSQPEWVGKTISRANRLAVGVVLSSWKCLKTHSTSAGVCCSISISAKAVSRCLYLKLYLFFIFAHVVVSRCGCDETGNAYAGSNQSPARLQLSICVSCSGSPPT